MNNNLEVPRGPRLLQDSVKDSHKRLASRRNFEPKGESMRDSYPMWKELYLEALLESDKQRLTGLVQTTEQAIASRTQELLNTADHHEERGEMAIALASLLAIKTHELGWPAVFARDGLS